MNQHISKGFHLSRCKGRVRLPKFLRESPCRLASYFQLPYHC